MEKNFSGYCRILDGSRLVFLEQENDGTWEADCKYGSGCPYQAECPIGREMTQFLKTQGLPPT